MGFNLIYWTPIWKNMEKRPFFRAATAELGKYRTGGCGWIGVYRVKPISIYYLPWYKDHIFVCLITKNIMYDYLHDSTVLVYELFMVTKLPDCV